MKRLSEWTNEDKACLQSDINLFFRHEDIIGRSNELRYVLYSVEQVAPTDTTVLITGEAGTGKELLAREIHRLSSRKNGDLLKINCAASPSALLGSDFFSPGNGTITRARNRQPAPFEVTRGATLFLDEIGALPLRLQAKLLSILRENAGTRLNSDTPHAVDVRIIAATRRNLAALVREGLFHEALWHHLNAFSITIPPLRNRLEDLDPLVDFFVQKISAQRGRSIEALPMSVMDSLRTYHWPGNIRELENVIKRVVMHSVDPELELTDVFKEIRKTSLAFPAPMGPPPGPSAGMREPVRSW